MTATTIGGEGAPGRRGRLTGEPPAKIRLLAQSEAVKGGPPVLALPYLKPAPTQHRPRLVVMTPVPLGPVEEPFRNMSLDPHPRLGGGRTVRLMCSGLGFLIVPPSPPPHPPRLPAFRPAVSCTCFVPLAPHPLVQPGDSVCCRATLWRWGEGRPSFQIEQAGPDSDVSHVRRSKHPGALTE